MTQDQIASDTATAVKDWAGTDFCTFGLRLGKLRHEIYVRGLTLPIVAATFLTRMAVLNALWLGPVTSEMDDLDAKLLQALTEANRGDRRDLRGPGLRGADWRYRSWRSPSSPGWRC